MRHVHHLGNVLVGVGHLLGQGGPAGPAHMNAFVFQFPFQVPPLGGFFGGGAGEDPAGPVAGGPESLRHGFFGPHQHIGGGAHVAGNENGLAHRTVGVA